MTAPRPDTRALLCAILLAALAPCCQGGEPRAPFACECTFVTDFDDDSRYDVEVCSPPAAETAAALARGCAQSGAPGPVQGCACRPVGELGACKGDACRALPR